MQCSRCQTQNRERERAAEHINAAITMYREVRMTFWLDQSATTARRSTVH